MFINILDEWETTWRDSIEFVDFLNDYVEINDDHKTYVIKKKKTEIEMER
jgi:hypothetical protein